MKSNRNLLIILTFVLVIAAIGYGVWRSQNVENKNDQELTSVELLIDWKAEPTYAGFYLAVEKGFYKKHGLDLTIVEGNGATTSAQIIGTGNKYFIGSCSGEATAIARSKGVPIKSVAVYYPNVPTVIYSRADTPIKTPDDLIGKKIGLIDGSITVDEYRGLVETNKIDRSKIEEVSVGWEVAPLLTKQVDGLLNYGELTPVELELQGHKLETLRLADFGVDAYSLNLIVNDDALDSKAEIIAAIVEGTNEGYEFLRNKPEESAEIFSNLFPERNRDFVTKSIEVVASQLGDGEIGIQTNAGWSSTIKTLSELGLIENTVEVNDVAADRFLHDDKSRK